MVFFQNFPDADIQLGIRIVRGIGGNHPHVQSRFAAERVNADRDMAPVFFVIAGKLLEPQISVAQIAHKIRDNVCPRNVDLFRMPAFDRRTRDVFQVAAQDHVRAAAEHLA